jgi:hypothetical protein
LFRPPQSIKRNFRSLPLPTWNMLLRLWFYRTPNTFAWSQTQILHSVVQDSSICTHKSFQISLSYRKSFFFVRMEEIVTRIFNQNTHKKM